MPATLIERTIKAISPQWHLRRARAAHAARHYEAAADSRRTQGWRANLSDPNAAAAGGLDRLRYLAHDLVRNNPYAEAAVSIITNHAIGWGIKASQEPKAWQQWAETTACDADGRHDFYGLQKLVLRTVVTGGEILVRKRLRRPEDNLPIPLQLQLLEPDYLDTLKNAETLPNGGRIIQGVEFGPLGNRQAYWLFTDHPGGERLRNITSQRVPAESILHIGKSQRPGQVRFVTWFAPVLVTFNDFADLEDATLMKQKVAACLGLITTDPDGRATELGTVDPAAPTVDALSPGMILNLPAGRSVSVVDPPTVSDYGPFSTTQLRKMATGLGVTYEDMTGDYSQMNFSSARMSLIRHWAHVDDWRWRMMVPQFLNPVWGWCAEAQGVMGQAFPAATEWQPPPMPMVDPDKEGLAAMRNVRTGIQTLSQVIRERGFNPKRFLDELQRDFEDLDDRGLVLDCDPRKVSQQGQFQNQPSTSTEKTETKEDADKDSPESKSTKRTKAGDSPDGTTPKDEQTIFGYHLQYGVAKLGDARKNLGLPSDPKTDHMTVPEYLIWLGQQPNAKGSKPAKVDPDEEAA